MYVLPLPAFADNYIWMLHDGYHALVVDPGDATPVLQTLQNYGLQLQAILVTHHHHDHTDGIAPLQAATGAPVWGPAHERGAVPWMGLCAHPDSPAPPSWLNLTWHILDTPGHTAGHICYYCPDIDGAPLLFCGDTLFSGGCGRLFEGTAAQMLASLDQLSALPDDTRICCAHEYTVSNVHFARTVEPDNLALQRYQHHCQALRTHHQPTLPARMAHERDINPFLRTRTSCVALAVQQHAPEVDCSDPIAVLAALRTWKNHFR